MPIFNDVSIGSSDSIRIQSLDAFPQYSQFMVVLLDQFIVSMSSLLPSSINLLQVFLSLFKVVLGVLQKSSLYIDFSYHKNNFIPFFPSISA